MGRIGTCSLCLERGDLSYEHIPPRRVFNHLPAVAHTIYGLEEGSRHKKPPTLLERHQGLGKYVFCRNCNGKTAEWYGDAFADWTAQCLRFAERFRGGNNVLLPFHIAPLRVLKQTLTMALATTESRSSNPVSDVIRYFLLNRQSMDLDPRVQIRAYFNPRDPARVNDPHLTQNRLSANCAVMDIRSGLSVFVLAEVAFPPMGYVVYSAADTERVSSDFATLADLRIFRTYHFDQNRDLFLRIPVRYPFGPVPGYYPNLNRPQGCQFVDDDHLVITGKEKTA